MAKRRQIPSGYVSIAEAVRLSGVARETFWRAIKGARLPAHCVGCHRMLEPEEFKRGHRCLKPPTWGHSYRIMLPKYLARTFRGDALQAAKGRARWARRAVEEKPA